MAAIAAAFEGLVDVAGTATELVRGKGGGKANAGIQAIFDSFPSDFGNGFRTSRSAGPNATAFENPVYGDVGHGLGTSAQNTGTASGVFDPPTSGQHGGLRQGNARNGPGAADATTSNGSGPGIFHLADVSADFGQRSGLSNDTGSARDLRNGPLSDTPSSRGEREPSGSFHQDELTPGNDNLAPMSDTVPGLPRSYELPSGGDPGTNSGSDGSRVTPSDEVPVEQSVHSGNGTGGGAGGEMAGLRGANSGTSNGTTGNSALFGSAAAAIGLGGTAIQMNAYKSMQKQHESFEKDISQQRYGQQSALSQQNFQQNQQLSAQNYTQNSELQSQSYQDQLSNWTNEFNTYYTASSGALNDAGLPSYLAFSPAMAASLPKTSQYQGGRMMYTSKLPGDPTTSAYTGQQSQSSVGWGNVSAIPQ